MLKEAKNEIMIAELEKEIERRLQEIDGSKLGCFGTPLCSQTDDMCLGCPDFRACLETPKDNLFASAEAEVNKIIADYELEIEMAEMKKASKKSKMHEPPTQDKTPIAITEIDISSLGKRTRIAFDFNKAKDMILSEQPSDFKQVRKICVSMVEKAYTSTAYANANKIMKKLEEIGVVKWNSEKKIIEYPVAA